MKRRWLIFCFVLVAFGCKPKPENQPPAGSATPAPAATGITDREWTLVQLGENASPLGNGGKPVTLTLASAEARASGNAGCNRYSGPYTLSGRNLTFGPAISTKMACAQGMDVETAYLSMLPNVTSFQATDSSLVLMGASGELARFR
jgi:heat shock protein HslJ